MNLSRIFRLFVQSAFLLGILMLFAIALTRAQNGSLQNSAAIFIKGTVRDRAGAPVVDATVVLEEKARSASLEAKTGTEGTFSFLTLRAGVYVVRARKVGSREAATEPIELSLGQKKNLDLVLDPANPGESASPGTAQPSSSSSSMPPSSSAAMEFSDKPNFTVAGVTDWSNVGLHGSDTHARTSESLAKDTLALKAGGLAPTSAEPSAKSQQARTHRISGDGYEKSGDPLAAVREYEAAARLDPSEPNYFAWGTELLLHRAVEPAVEVFTKGSSAHANSSRILIALAAALYAARSYDQAAGRLCQASDLKPSDTTPYLFLGKMQKTVPDLLPCAEEALARFARGQPDNALAHYFYAIALWKRARRAENSTDLQRQEALLERAVTLDPQFAEAYLQLGILYAAQNRFEPAIRAYKKAIAGNADLGEAHYRLGLAYKRMGDSNAEQEFQLYKQAERAESAAIERQRKELQQFVIILKDQAAASPPPR